VLERLDRDIQHFEPGQMATVIYALFDRTADTLRFSSAGHLPPALAHPGVPTEFVDSPVDISLGVEPAQRHSVTVALPPGSLVCLFTDGLVERRGDGVDPTLRRLKAVLDGGVFDTAEAVCAEVMADLVGDRQVEDDIALLVLKR
jgi:serine phosphatase RsbU (regulator of sigma subunit)